MSVFVDTSGFYAFLVATERRHEAVRQVFEGLLAEGTELHTSSYILVESVALLQARVGIRAVRDLDADLMPLVSVTWVDQRLHGRGMRRLRRQGRRRLSLVDCVSFECMRDLGISRAVTLDRHFEEAGFERLPAIQT